MNPKTKAILDQVRILAQEYPDFVYPNDGYHACKYNAGVDPKYPDLCGCIIGQAARRADIDTSDWDAIPIDPKLLSPGISTQIEGKLGEDRYSPEAYILIHTQSLQDRGIPWGEAYAKATEETE